MTSEGLRALMILTSGDCPPTDRSYWLSKVRLRAEALADDADVFGLVPAELDELEALQAFLERSS